MATITLVISDAHLQRAVDALCVIGGFDEANGTNRAAFARSVAAALVRDAVLGVERQQRETAALAAAGEPEPIDIA